MLSINNIALPEPGSLSIGRTKAVGTDYLNLSLVKAAWSGLDTEAMKLILKDTGQSFTLGCLNPRTGAVQGTTCKLTACEARPMPGTGLYEMNMIIEEIA